MARRAGVPAVDQALALDGKSSPKRRAAGKPDITDEQIATFLATLAETCNVVRSAKAAGFAANWAYRKRKTDATFRNGWATAVREGYAKLELVLLERAMKGTPKPVVGRDGSERIVREYSTALAVALLKRHAETADSASYEPDEDELRELRESILAKLEKLRGRALRDGASTCSTPPQDEREIETKSAVDRVETIRWALGRQEPR